MATKSLTGGCQCGALRYAISGDALAAAYCHCRMCQRANAAPVVAWAMFNEDQVTFTRGAPARYASSPGAERTFCQTCGTPIGFTADYMAGLIDITIASLDDPEAIVPAEHIWTSSQRSWLKIDDDLPRHPEMPPFEP